MLFTANEMELICVFHSGTLTETLEMLRSVLPGIELSAKKADAVSVVEKLSRMKPGDQVSLAFELEE